jgi:chromate transporter
VIGTGAVRGGAAGPAAPRPHGVPFAEAVRTWARVAALSFGGPAGQIAVMHRILVEEKRWIGENRFLHALNYWARSQQLCHQPPFRLSRGQRCGCAC